MTKISKSDKKEFLSRYKEMHDSFAGFCRAKAYGIMDPKDLISESVLRVLENYHKIKDKQALKSYLFTTASNLVFNNLRKSKFSSSLEIETLDSRQTKEMDAETLLDIEILYSCLKKLSKEEEDALMLFEISGFGIKEIAKMSNSSESAIKQRLRRGRIKLRKLMEEPSIERA